MVVVPVVKEAEVEEGRERRPARRRKRRWTLRNRGVIRGVDASIAAYSRANSTTTRLPGAFSPRASLGCNGRTHTTQRFYTTFSTSTFSPTSLPRTCVHASAPRECERTYGRSSRSTSSKNVGSGPRGSASLQRARRRAFLTFTRSDPTPNSLSQGCAPEIRWNSSASRWPTDFISDPPFVACWYSVSMKVNEVSPRFSRVPHSLIDRYRYIQTLTDLA